MAIDPGKTVPQDTATVKSLQSTTEASAKAAMRAPIDDAFGFAKDGLFGVLLRSIGGVLSGAIDLGVGALSWVVDGVVGLISGIANAVSAPFRRDGLTQPEDEPYPEIFNPIKTNLEGMLEPLLDDVDASLAESASLGEEARSWSAQALSKSGEAVAAATDAHGVIQGLVDQGRAHAESALEHAADSALSAVDGWSAAGQAQAAAQQAEELTTTMEGLVEDAEQAVVDGRAEVTRAKQHADAAAASSSSSSVSLSSAQAVLTLVEDDAADVSTRLTQVVSLHQEVLTKHGEAITSATNAASAATNAAGSALDGLATLGEAQAVQLEVNRALSAGVRAAASSAASSNVAVMQLSMSVEETAKSAQHALDSAEANADALLQVTKSQDEAARAQGQAEEAQAARDDAQDAAQEAQASGLRNLMQSITRPMFIPRGTVMEDDYIRVAPVGSNNFDITALGDWVGKLTFQSVYSGTSGFEPVLDGFDVGVQRDFTGVSYRHNQSILMYWVFPGSPGQRELETGRVLLTSASTWSTITDLTYTSAVKSQHNVLFRVHWDAAHRGSAYEIRVVRVRGTSRTTIKTAQSNRLGPTFPWENGYRTQTVRMEGVDMVAGDRLEFQVLCSNSDSDSRLIRKTETDLSWIIPPTES